MKTRKNKESIGTNSALKVAKKKAKMSSIKVAVKNAKETSLKIVLKKEKRRSQSGKRYCKWSEKKMIQALDAMRNRGMGLNKAAKNYAIPKATLKRHLEGTNLYASEGKKVMGSQKSLPHDIEEEIKARVIQSANSPTGMTGKELRKFAYDIAEAKGITHKFSKNKQTAGRHWYYSFRRRYPELNLQGPNTTTYILGDALRQQETRLTGGELSTKSQNPENEQYHPANLHNEATSESVNDESTDMEKGVECNSAERRNECESKLDDEERSRGVVSENENHLNMENQHESDSESQMNEASKYVDAILEF